MLESTQNFEFFHTFNELSNLIPGHSQKILNPKESGHKERLSGQEVGEVSPKPPGLHELVSAQTLAQSPFLEKEGTLYLMPRIQTLEQKSWALRPE